MNKKIGIFEQLICPKCGGDVVRRKDPESMREGHICVNCGADVQPPPYEAPPLPSGSNVGRKCDECGEPSCGNIKGKELCVKHWKEKYAELERLGAFEPQGGKYP